MTKKTIYFLPEGIKDVNELLESRDFKKFIRENSTQFKTGIKDIDEIMKNGIPAGRMNVILGNAHNGQSLMVKYLKSLGKPKTGKKYRYFFEKVFNEAELKPKSEIKTNMKPSNYKTQPMITLTKESLLPTLSSTVHVTRDYFMFKDLDGEQISVLSHYCK